MKVSSLFTELRYHTIGPKKEVLNSDNFTELGFYFGQLQHKFYLLSAMTDVNNYKSALRDFREYLVNRKGLTKSIDTAIAELLEDINDLDAGTRLSKNLMEHPLIPMLTERTFKYIPPAAVKIEEYPRKVLVLVDSFFGQITKTNCRVEPFFFDNANYKKVFGVVLTELNMILPLLPEVAHKSLMYKKFKEQAQLP